MAGLNPSPRRESAAVVAAAASFALAALKLAGFLWTGSTALLASAADSAADVVVSGVNALTVRAADAPPDQGHPFGHGKFEHLGALGQALILFGVGGGVLWSAARRGVDPEPLRDPWIGVGVSAVSLIGALALSRFLSRAGKRHDSPALSADAAHYAADWLTNAGALFAILAERLAGWGRVDPLVAALTAAAVLRLGWRTLTDAAGGLLDARLAGEELALVRKVLEARAPVVRGYHDLLTRRAGPTRFIQLHIELDADLTFRETHRIVESVVRDLEQAIPRAVVTIHADPVPPLPDDGETAPVLETGAAREGLAGG
ncbi:MAG TPA: cation diffusion facilitator family transporter [Planctomycetota bacterium]|nr:cation diffusion facilitator family transporter [Planctomycetota bacterium]